MPVQTGGGCGVLRAVCVLIVLLIGGCSKPPTAPDADAIAENNRGVGLMGQYRNDEAEVVFAQLAQRFPGWTEVRINHAIAMLNRQREGDEQRALDLAEAVLIEAPQSLRARYVAGLAMLYLGQIAEASGYLRQVAEADPEDAHANYFAAQSLLQLGEPEAALEAFQRAIEHDAYLRSAYYGASMAQRRLGDPEAAQRTLDDYQQLDGNPRAHLAEFRYTRMGRKAEALAAAAPQALRPERAEGPLLQASVLLAQVALDSESPSLSVADITGDGSPEIFIAGGHGHPSRVYALRGDTWESLDSHPLASEHDVVAAAWADIDNDGHLDVYLCKSGSNRLLSGAEQAWRPMPGSEQVADDGRCADVAVLDADHDGDLDIWLANVDGANELFSNNSNGSFRRLSAEPGSAGLGISGASRGLLAVDLQGDRDLDLLVVQATPPHPVLLNDRLWRYRDAEGFESLQQTDLVALTAADANARGLPTLYGVDARGRLLAWAVQRDGLAAVRELAARPPESSQRAALAVLDLSGEGRPQLLWQHAGGFELFDLSESGAAETRWAESLDLLAAGPILRDPARGPELIALVAGEAGMELRLWPAGGGRQPFLAIAPSGKSAESEGMRSNSSGLGTSLSLRVADRWSRWDFLDRHSAPGQSLQALAIGLGGSPQADFVEFTWSDGVYQTEMALAAGRLHRIEEQQRQLASCPVLFAWNGERFAFVSDVLGVGGMGFLLAPGVYAEPRPWEFFRFPDGAMLPRDGAYRLKIGEPMEEVAYVDQVRLHLHDLPPGWSLVLDERMYTGGGPQPDGQPRFYREARVLHPARVLDNRGEDQATALRHADGVAAPPGRRDPRFLGRLADEHALVLEFDQVINPPGSQPVLLAEGWVEYPYSQTMFSAWQADADYRYPSLDAWAGGRWHAVHEGFGYPAGMPREMSLPLDALPPETLALRLRGNLEIYWDSIAVIHAEAAPREARATPVPASLASVAKVGFPKRDTLAQRRPHYDYERRQPFWDTRYPAGFYTELGPATELVQDEDAAMAIIGPGDELDLVFPEPPAPAAGWRRIAVLEIRGYAKDMDLYTRDGEQVGPLPVSAEPGTPAWHLHQRHNTRYQRGR